MSKKKKKSKGYFEYAYGGGKKKSKGSRKGKSHYSEPRLKVVKPTLDKKDAKESKKIIMAPVDVPKAFRKNREKCNHAGANTLISVAEFKAITPTYAAYTPMLETAVKVFGEDAVSVCRKCFDIVVDPAAVDQDKIQEAMAVLYAAANIVVSRKRMKSEEIKDVAKLRDALTDWNGVLNIFAELSETGALESSGTASSNTGVDYSKLNQVGSSSVT